MHFRAQAALSLAFLGSAAAVAVPLDSLFAERAACNENNCLRAVIGGRRGPAFPPTATSDCVAFVQQTSTVYVTPGTATITETASQVVTDYVRQTVTTRLTQTVVESTVEVDVTTVQKVSTVTTYQEALAGRAAAPTIPAYASPCAGAAAYSSACSCIGVKPTTVTVVVSAPTPTATASAQVTSTDVKIITVIETQTTSVTSTARSTTVTTATALSTSLVVIPVSYTLKYSAPRCAYNRYYAAPNVGSEAACRARCTADPRCRFYAFSQFDPALTNGFSGYECDLDDQPYNSAYLQCNYVTSSFVAYNKN